jgi:diguanylate cyclase (GGDEF)-like protein/PAS domain S-box-containing protein
MKEEQKIILVSAAGGAVLWTIDALFDSVMFPKGPSGSSLLPGGMYEFFMRSLLLPVFIVFGVLLSGFFAKRRRLENVLRDNEKLYRMFFEGAGDAIFILEAEGEKTGRIVSVNKAAADMHGYTVDELLSRNITDLDAADAARELPARIERLLKGEWIKAEIRHRKKDGTVFPVEISAGILELGDRKYILAFDRDITERKDVEKALKESEDKYRSVMQSVGDSIYLVDRACRYLFMNKKHQARLGQTGDGYIGQAYGYFHSPEETKELSDNVETVLKTGETIQHEHLSLRDNRYFLRTLSPVKDSDGYIWAVTVVSKDVNELKQLENKLRNLSFTDDLTGLYNRRGFFTMIEQILKLAKREKRGVFLVYADLDNLKAINDLLGHHEGDQALVQAVAILRATFRESDIMARIGGDEFVVIPMDSGEDNADVIKARFQKNLIGHNERTDHPFTLSISLGMAYYDPDSSCSVDELLRRAEKLMYDDKCLRKRLKSN